MTFEEQVYDYANKAQSKILEFADTINGQLKIGNESPVELACAIELLDFHESLLGDLNPWSEEDTIYWMEYFIVKYNMVEIPWVDTDIFVLPIGIPSGIADGANYATVVALAAETASRQAALEALEDRLDALEADHSDIVPQSLIDDVSDNKAVIAGLAGQVAEILNDLEADSGLLGTHEANTEKHIQPGERTVWNAKVSTAALSTALLGFASKVHTHTLSDVSGLPGILNSLQLQITNFPFPDDGVDGATPLISIGTVEEADEFSVELDPTSTLLNPILNFTFVRGEKGDGLTIDKTDDLDQRGAYGTEDIGFTYLAQDTGDLYILLAENVWSDPIPFKGHNGWTPRLALYEHSADRVLLEIAGFIGGSGDEPEMDGGSEASPRFFLMTGGFTTVPENAVNIKGRAGADGVAGRNFIIDQEGTDRSVYDDELEGFTYLNSLNGKVSWKLSDTSSDWSAEFQWKGDDGDGLESFLEQDANTFFAGPASGAEAIPTFRSMVIADISATGTPDTTTFLRGDWTWAVPPGGGSGVSDGDKGDIVVSGSGAVWTIDPDTAKDWTEPHSFPVVRIGGTGGVVESATMDSTLITMDSTIVTMDSTANLANVFSVYGEEDNLIFGVGESADGPWVSINVGEDASGDMYFRSSGALQRIPIGSVGEVMTIDSFGNPTWGALSGSGTITNYWKTDQNFSLSNTLTVSNTNGRILKYNFTNGDYTMLSQFVGHEVNLKVSGLIDFVATSAMVQVLANGVNLNLTDTNGSTTLSLTENHRIVFTSNDPSFPGATYDADYSLNYDDLSIPHVAWVLGVKEFVGSQTFKAGTIDSAPLYLQHGVAMADAEDGALEYHDNHLYFTIGLTRHQLDQQSGGSGGGVAGLTAGRVTVASGATALTDDALFLWNSTNKYLTVGTARMFTVDKTADDLFIGENAGNFTTVGSGANIGIGLQAGYGLTTGHSNTFLGWGSGMVVTSGVGNVLIGTAAGQNITTGEQNIVLGRGAGSSITTGSLNIMIGDQIQLPSATASGQLSIQNIIYGKGNSTTGVTVGAGNIGIAVSNPTARLHLAAGQATAEKAPLKLTTGVALTTPEDGAIEYHGSHLYFTIGSTRYQLDQQGSGGGITDLGYTASTRILTSSTGADVTLPLFTNTAPGLVNLSGGGTSNFLRADGTWAAPSGGSSVTASGGLTKTGDDIALGGTLATGVITSLTTTTGALDVTAGLAYVKIAPAHVQVQHTSGGTLIQYLLEGGLGAFTGNHQFNSNLYVGTVSTLRMELNNLHVRAVAGSVYTEMTYAGIYHVGSGTLNLKSQSGDVQISAETVGKHIILSNLPTSAPAAAGRVWNDAGTLKISI